MGMSDYQICPKCGKIAYARSLYDSGYYCFPKQGGCGTKFPAKIDKVNDLFCHTITANDFLKSNITAYFHDYYIPIKDGGGKFTDIILSIKGQSESKIESAKCTISEIIRDDLDKLIKNDNKYNKQQPIIIVVPRAKPDNFYKPFELQFKTAVSMGLKKSTWVVKDSNTKWMIDGTQYLIRTSPTQTTHLAHKDIPENIGPSPYAGITKDTCKLSGNVKNQNIILIDDIYTENKGIDEDCIQFLLDNGAKDVTLYTLGKTGKPYDNTVVDISGDEVPF